GRTRPEAPSGASTGTNAISRPYLLASPLPTPLFRRERGAPGALTRATQPARPPPARRATRSPDKAAGRIRGDCPLRKVAHAQSRDNPAARGDTADHTPAPP